MTEEELQQKDIEALELENIILKQIIIELNSDWLSPKFDHIWEEQTKLYSENEEEEQV